ncbi:MAG: energy transducer TonB [Acidobacteriaceae bacterium]
MLLARSLNGLASMGSHPWHVKADFQTFNPDGKPKENGTFEEWWAGTDMYKISYTGKSFNHVKYRNGDKVAVTGDLGGPSFQESMAEPYLMHPLPGEKAIEDSYYAQVKQKMGPVTLECIRPTAKSIPGNPANQPGGLYQLPVPTTCFAPGTPIIRLEISGHLLTIFNDVAQAGGHYFARDISVENVNQPIVNIKITELEFPPKIEDAEVLAPASAVASPVSRVKASVMAGNRIGGKDPTYPWIAKSQRVEGMVMLAAVITKAGDIGNLQLISGPKALRQSALDAVKTWKYKPYTLNGQPVTVETTINVIYTMGG